MQFVWKKAGAVSALTLLACLLVTGGLAGPARADDDDEGAEAKPRSYPHLEVEGKIELHHDYVFDADDSDAEGHDTFTESELEVGLHLSPFFSLHGGFVLEPIEDREPGEDRFFEDQGLFIEQLYGKFTFEPVSVLVGKFNPAFGFAWDKTPGVYGTDLAEDYELTERVGVGISIERKNTGIGNLKLEASAFYADTSFLSRSFINDRGELDRADGGLSNTGNLDSFVVSLTGEKIPGLAGFSYNIGFVHQAGGEDDIDDQNGVVVGIESVRKYNNVEFKWLAETAYFDYGGDLFEAEDEDLFVDTLWYWTLGAEATFNDKYRIAAAYTARNAELFDGSEFDDYQYQLSAGVNLGRDWWLDVGYKFLQEEDEDSHTIGLMLAKEFKYQSGELEPEGKPLK
jgi:hypothetical protein